MNTNEIKRSTGADVYTYIHTYTRNENNAYSHECAWVGRKKDGVVVIQTLKRKGILRFAKPYPLSSFFSFYLPSLLSPLFVISCLSIPVSVCLRALPSCYLSSHNKQTHKHICAIPPPSFPPSLPPSLPLFFFPSHFFGAAVVIVVLVLLPLPSQYHTTKLNGERS